ncbi:MAG TPA: OmpA family protein [Puia sp.]|nr:OmpA family protein [Puia sp.]
MRKPFLACLLAAGGFSAQAQVRLGVVGGLHSSNVIESNHLAGYDTSTKRFFQSRSGFELGLMLEVPLGHNLYFQPSMTYITKGRRYDRNYDSLKALASDTIYNKSSLNLNYIEIPLDLTYKFPLTPNGKNNIFFSLGPYVSFIYGGNITTQSLTADPQQFNSETDPVTVGKGAGSYKTLDIGANGKLGFELGNIMVSAYFSRGITSFYNAPYPGTFRHTVFGASLGIWLNSAGTPPHLKKKDTDKDGIPDDQDACPLKPGTAKYQGCPVPDTDHDGVDDEHDSCPTVAGLARYNGCPIPDRDGDGVNDEIDQCPDSAGPASNHGCPLPPPVVVAPPPPAPVIRKEDSVAINYIAHNVLFNSGSDRFQDSTSRALDELANRLAAHPEWHLTIEGHTDASGNPSHNMQLSQKRATAIRNYLLAKGIAASRLTAIGYGQTRPVADNRTTAGKAANRRVELRLSIEKQ